METVQVLGLKELNNALQQLSQHFQTTVLQHTLLIGAKFIVADAISRVPKRTGTLAKAIFSYKDKRGSTTTFESRFIGVRTGARTKKGRDDAYYWKWIEFGHGEITIKAGEKSLGVPGTGFFGKTVKAYPAHPFLRPAFEAQKYVAQRAIVAQLAEELEAAARAASWKIIP